MQRPHWAYYLTIVQDLENLSRYIDFSEANTKTYSIELVRLLLSICSEVDVVCKVLCRPLTSSGKRLGNIDQYRESRIAQHPQLPNIAVSAPQTLAFVSALGVLESVDQPRMWTAYNDVKHERDSFYQQATLWNVLMAASGLCVLVGYLYRDWFEKTAINQRPFLFFDRQYNDEGVIPVKPRLKLP